MQDDFNTPLALSLCMRFVKEGDALLATQKFSTEETKATLVYIKEIDKVFGFLLLKEDSSIPIEVQKLIKRREDYRRQRKWKEADAVREDLVSLGFTVQDADTGVRVKVKKTL